MSGCTGGPFPLGAAPWLWVSVGWRVWWAVDFYSHFFPFPPNVGTEGTQFWRLISSESICVAVTLPSTSHPGCGGDVLPQPWWNLVSAEPALPPRGRGQERSPCTEQSVTASCLDFREPGGSRGTAGSWTHGEHRAVSHRPPSSYRFLINFLAIADLAYIWTSERQVVKGSV